MTQKLERFDLHLPAESVTRIKELANQLAIPPRVYARYLLVKKIEETNNKKEVIT